MKRSVLAAFAGPGIPIAAVGLPMIVYLPPFYAGDLGLDLATVGLIFFLVRAVDLPLDPFLGHLMDGTRSRLGRYRPWLLAGGLVMAAGAWLVFMAEPGISAPRAFLQLLLLYIGLSITMVALLGWAAALSDDYHQRSRIFGWLQGAKILGMVLVLALPPAVAALAGGDGTNGIRAMGWFVIILAPLTALLMAVRVPERARTVGRVEAKLADVLALARNQLVRKLLLLDMVAGMAPGITGAMFLFYFEHRLGFPPGVASLLLLVYFVTGFAATPLWLRLALRIGKHKAMAAACLVYGATHAAIGLLPAANLPFALAGMALAGLPFAATPFLLRAILADVADTDRLETGLERNALLQAVMTTTEKIAHALPVAFIYPLLSLISFDPRPNAHNGEDAVIGMSLVFVLAPLALMTLAAWMAARWPHDESAHAQVQAALAARSDMPSAG